MGIDGLHIEYLHMNDDDTKRHKSHCIFYWDGYCRCKNEKCFGSSQCSYYSENIDKLKEINLTWYLQVKNREDIRIRKYHKMEELKKNEIVINNCILFLNRRLNCSGLCVGLPRFKKELKHYFILINRYPFEEWFTSSKIISDAVDRFNNSHKTDKIIFYKNEQDTIIIKRTEKYGYHGKNQK